jgi:hypothetical protein
MQIYIRILYSHESQLLTHDTNPLILHDLVWSRFDHLPKVIEHSIIHLFVFFFRVAFNFDPPKEAEKSVS